MSTGATRGRPGSLGTGVVKDKAKAGGLGPETGGPIVVVDGLRKSYSKTVAVDGVSFSVSPGEIFGLLGPNGAGKSTTLAVMAGLIRPDAGDVYIGGHSITRATQKAQQLLGVVPQGLALYEELTAAQNLSYFATLRGIERSRRKQEIEEILEIVGLKELAQRKVSRYSGGMKRRLNIGIGLLGRPKVLLLDEPTVGIDPQSRRHILDSVRRLAEAGMAVVYTTHYMEEVEYLCSRLAIIDRGRIIAHGPIDEVRALAGDAVVLRLPVPQGVIEEQRQVEDLERALPVPVEIGGGELRIVLPQGSRQAPEVIHVLQSHGVPLDGMRLESPNLETVFLSLTGKGLRDGGPEEKGAAS